MGPETDIVEPVVSGRPAGWLAVCLAGWVSGMFVREICPGMYLDFPDIMDIATAIVPISATYLILI